MSIDQELPLDPYQSEVPALIERLLRDAGGRKVLVFSRDGSVLGHAGAVGALGERVADALAALLGELLEAPAAGEAQEDPIVSLDAGLSACATTLGARGALVVVFDQGTTAERVRAKMRRARETLVKRLPSESGPIAS